MRCNEPQMGRNMVSRVNDAITLFESGYNCAQSVFAAYAELLGMDQKTALKISCPMGAGIGRMREICGAVSAMSMLLGLKEGNTDVNDQDAKQRVYEKTRQMADRFKEESGSIICRELLGMEEREESAAPTVRTAAFYESRPCKKLVEKAAQIIEDIIFEDME